MRTSSIFLATTWACTSTLIQSFHPSISNVQTKTDHEHGGGYDEDENVHKWNRQRRCDEGFRTPCGPCEGVGGLVWGDRQDQIDYTSCSVVSGPDAIPRDELPTPVWGTFFQNPGYSEILIGEKADPFCLQPIPGKNPNANFCYRPEEGTIYYDMEHAMAIQIDLNLQILGIPKNVSSVMIHQGTDFWIANKLWLGSELCICVKFKHLYPLNSRWVETGTYVARERIMVEYLWEEMTLDHWIAGPHHFWTDIDTGIVVRMWQPFNGLEVIDPRSREELTKVITFPPPMCKKGGAAFRINCDDEGYGIECNAAECDWDSEEDTNNSTAVHHRSLSEMSSMAMQAIQQHLPLLN